MLVFPNAKINLGLNITAKRADGYHDIESCFYPIPIKDALEIIPSEKLEFQTTGLEIPGNYEHNLVIKAFNTVKERYNIPNVKIILHKHIPMGAGMGGGSADGSFMLNLLNDYFNLNLSISEREEMALQLGSDCPFFIENKPKFVSGRGEIFEDCNLDLSGMYLGIIYPGIHIGTAEAYSGIIPKKPDASVKEVINNFAIQDWKDKLKNDFEESVFQKHPQLKGIKQSLYDSGAIYASMTGSGSTIFGLFNDNSDVESIKADQILKL
ncbi:4-(cytidine 5'-diphospho)-2-C-methyl-D-erythritol kinase [Marivirga arenosa]|uniref:4-diphosphocytidyl-2-C-methyl-D-erythritol kinase n=1 Tax=Marivirga arenosa TaxID=3059076 RepID=A0AA51X525_9BACT|nr:4-(cytidine 5'-diphospho)-2-C-methyl-D-erythritol kinase [Marivirga sp. BKB1-2]WNB16834.1 4-(cytidine 5'-diphospho)-2-C-methyl-D-erythritol kinase [Marivirga sp. BKB1-2]